MRVYAGPVSNAATELNRRNMASRIVELIVEDLTDRKGLRQAWEGIDEDITEEIKAAWRDKAFEIIADIRD